MGPAVVRLTRGAGRSMLAGLASAGVLAAALVGVTPAAAASSPDNSPAQLASSRALTPGTGPVSIAVVVPITVPTSARSTGLIDPETLATDTAPTGVLTRQLSAVTGTAAVLAIDPMIIVSIRMLGTAMPPSARSWLAQLEALPNEKFPLGYADADPGVLAHADGGLDLLTDLDFQFGIDAADFAPAVSPSPTPSDSDDATATPTPSPTPTATAPAGPTPLPSNQDLLAFDYVADDVAWPAAGTVTQSDLAPLAATGYHSVLLDSSNLSAVASARVKLEGVDGIDGLVSDEELSALARDAVGAFGDAALQSALQRFDAVLGGMQAGSPGRSVIATLDRGWSVNGLHVRDLLQNIDAQTSAQSVGISAILSGPEGDAKLVDGTVPTAGGALVGGVLATVPQEAAFATVAGDQASRITSPRRLQLLSTMSVAWIESGSGWADRLGSYLTSSSQLLDAIKIVHGSSVLVTASNTTIPVTVSNALDVPVTVDIGIVPVNQGSNILRIDRRQVTLKVEPHASGRAFVPAQALGSGSVDATVYLRSAANLSVQVGSSDTLVVQLRPSWEGIGTTIVVVLLVLIFGGGIVRQVLRRRRGRRAGEDAAGTDPEDGAAIDPVEDKG
jgi:hypothetical protein